ncbi:cytidylyltransferase domain-containing protein [Magnetospirillum aberrantis]|uniref:Acylneuraminate cytidylyltransferase family protein n=1 Tax=Magnetospirillum aberrantis SpK TaxID=908842 RepID=A0A7C9QRE2_9PROT|nr:acylneuraminate cytidylyltransferase family protein [Magnetospirillum aberrantis]NFV78544.1 acylneuraminate cytidylyltransferase family protein [Magnetospirillum aberrantis SpK]
MLDGKRVLAVIPARGGSKGVPRKNLRPLCGRPLIGWSIEETAKSLLIDRLVVSTEDEEIARTARDLGAEVPFLRPAEFSTDTARPEDAIVHLLRTLDDTFDYVAMLHSTVPLRRVEDVDGTLRACHDRGATAAVACCVPGKTPFWMLTENADGRMVPLMGWDGFVRRRQDQPKVLIPTGAVFVSRVEAFLQTANFYGADTVPYEMPAERAVDIDTPLDFQMCEFMMARGMRTGQGDEMNG